MLKLIARFKASHLSNRVGRNALEQARFKLHRDLRDMERIEQRHPDLLAPGLFFAWHRHQALRQACEGYAADIARLTGSTAEAVLLDALAVMVADRQMDSAAAALYRRWFKDDDDEDEGDDLADYRSF